MKEQQTPDAGPRQALSGGAVEIIDRQHLKLRIERGDRLRVKLGLDPTRPDIHLGHTVQLRELRRFQDLGHTAVLIIGDTTARIGDPSGQSVTRPQLSREEVDSAAGTYLRQAWKILDEARTEVRFQTEWFDKKTLDEIVGLMSKYTVARMLVREDFSKRLKEGRPISLHELLYPLLQGYDSVAVRSDVELGGTDQTFNLLVGRDLQQAFGQPPQDIVTLPLLEGTDGVQKMSKSLDNYIGIDESPEVMYRKVLGVPDALILRYLQLLTDASVTEVAAERAALEAGENPRDVKRRLAERLVRQFHPDASPQEYRRSDGAFVTGGPDEFSVAPGERALAQLFLDAGLVSSKGEARRLAAQRGLFLNDRAIDSAEERVTPVDGWLLRRGAHRSVRLKVR
ncbi:MAG TPA: tyrosine--tRNA ligase [Candidatus Dormibacteraeota bacterium]|nr:tyrosine--tRNA ligase [Candidatus Dormibacteraeota bacterium]